MIPDNWHTWCPHNNKQLCGPTISSYNWNYILIVIRIDYWKEPLRMHSFQIFNTIYCCRRLFLQTICSICKKRCILSDKKTSKPLKWQRIGIEVSDRFLSRSNTFTCNKRVLFFVTGGYGHLVLANWIPILIVFNLIFWATICQVNDGWQGRSSLPG